MGGRPLPMPSSTIQSGSLWPVLLAVFLFGFPLLEVGDLGVDALQPHGVPHPHSVESGSVKQLGMRRGAALRSEADLPGQRRRDG